MRRRFLAHAESTPDAWSRDSPVAHLTASALITDATAYRVCLVWHRKVERWLQTGGHLERGDVDLADAAAREAREESGLTVALDPVPLLLSEHPAPCRRPTDPPCAHYDVQFRAVADPTGRPQASAESRAAEWFAADALPDTDATVRALVAAARRRASLD